MAKKRTGLDALREYEARNGRQTQSEAQTEGSSGGAWRSGLDALRQFEANGGGRNVKNGEFNPNYRTMTRAMYESAYERYKRAAEAQERYSRAADAVGSSPVGGYIRAMRPPVKQPNFAEKTVEHDQESGQRRTQYELRRQIDQLEKARDYALSMQADDPEGLPELRGAYDEVNAGRTKPMTLTEMDEALREKRYRRAVLEKSVSGRLGEYAADLGRGVFKGGFEQAMTGFESVLGYLEQGANGAAAWALRDLAKAVPDGGLKDKMLALADDFNSYYTGESMTSHEEIARLHRQELEKLEAEIADKYKGVPLWIQQQMPSLGNMLFGAGVSGSVGVNNLATLGVTAGGNSALDAKEKGASDAQALAYGVVAGGLEVFSEKLFGGNPIYDTDAGLVNKAVGKLTDNKTIMKILNSKAFDIASEGLEEVVTEVLDPVAEWAIYNGSNTEFADAESIGNAFLGGVFLSVVGNVADAPNQIRQARYERVIRTAGAELADIAQTVDSAPVQEAAQVIRDKLAYGVTPDAADIGAVLDAIDQAGETVDVEQVREAVTAEEGAAETAQREANFQAYSRYAEERDARARAAEEEVSQARAQEYTEAINDAEANAADKAFEKLNEAEIKGALDAQARWQAEDARAERQFELESREDTERALREAAQRYGYDERMTSVLLSGYDGAQSAQQYAEAVNTAYEYGRNGLSLTAARRAAEGIDAGLAQEAWNAGKEIANGEKAGAARPDDGGKRNAGMDSGKPVGAVAGSAGGTAARSAAGRAVAERIGLENRVSAAGQPYLSGKDIGLSKGSAQRSFREAPERTWTDGMKAAAGTLKRAGFTDVHFTVGSISVENQRAKVTRYVDGAAVGDTVWVNATAKKWSVQQLADHEAFHRQVQDAPYLLDSVRAVLADELGDSGIRELAQRYAEAYEGCYDGAELDAYIEEICADAYAGMDRFPEEKAKIIQKAARQAQDAQQAAEENGKTRGPPEKYSVSEADSREQTQDEITAAYQDAVHGILNGTINSKGALLVGYTPEVYRKLGMPDLPFVVGSGHVYSIAKTQDEAKAEGRFRKNTNYHGLGERAVADILKAVKNPVMVISAKDVDRNATPLRSTHSVVALVDVGTNGKSLVVPVSITAQSTVDGTVMDVNMISSVYEKNARGLVNEAIAQFNSGENSIFYVTKKAATLAGEGVQFPSILQAAATSSDGIVRKFGAKVNMSIENVTQSQQFKRWFGDWQNKPETASKVVNADGTPKVVYHQTGNDFTIFDVRKNGAGTRDNETPFGIFLKSSGRDIGLNGKKQMALYANIRNPLYARDRADLTRQLRELSPEYDAIRQEHAVLDKEYKQKFEDAKKNFVNFLTEWKKNHPGESSRSLYGTPEFERVFDAEDAVVEEWTSKADVLSVRAKEVLTDAIKQAGFDGVVLANDAGSWGRSTDAYIALSENQVKSATDNVGTFDRDNPDIRYSVAEADAGAEGATAFTLDSIPKKAQDYLRRVRGQTAAAIQQTLSMPFAARQEVLKPAIEEMMNEYLQTGRISQETVDRSFEESYRRGVEMDTEFYDEYKDVKTRLRDLKVTLSETDRADIADFNDFRRAAFGRLRIADEGGLPVDTAYNQMREMAPELFPASVTHPADQLMQMFEVSKRIERVQRSLDEFHGEEAEEFKRWAKNDYEASVENMLGSLRVARRYAEARMRQKQARTVPTTMEEVKGLYAELKRLRRTYERAAAKNLLTAEDNNVLNRLLRGDLAPEDVQGMENAKGILAMYEAKADYDEMAAKIADWRRYQKAQRLATADAALKNADQAKDKAAGIQYSRETMTRNVRDIFPEADAEIINRTYFEPVRTASANANKLKNKLREQVKALDLSRKANKGDAVSEAHAVQLLGEAQDNIRYLEQHPRAQDRDGKTLNEWRQIVLDLWATSPGLDRAKIENAVETFRKIYDGLFEQMNDVRIRNGYEPINYRQGYFPHFQPGTTDGILGLMGKALGIDAEVTALPTTISGLTHTFKPGITYFGNALERIGFNTEYDAVAGFDKYVEGAASVICYTDVIQNLRALAQQVRYRTSDEGLRERVDDVRARDDLTEHQKELEIEAIMKQGRFSLSNFAVELDEYTNLLANKKSKYDRSMEHLGGRKLYNFMRAWQNRVAANMVAVNPASWLTNFGVITQAGAQLKTISVLKGMWQTLANIKTNDGLVEASDFLTNRAGSDPLVRTWQQSASTFLSTPMEWIDQFSAGTIVRARYMENIERGMSEEAAMREADDFAANVMADRSKGAMPTIFESRNPLMKMLTQFQLEVNNTFSYLFKDLPREQRKKGVRYLAWALFKFLIGGYLYNEVYEYLIGRRPMLDPLGIVNDTVGDLTGYELNNLVDAAAGGGLIKESEQESAIRSAGNLAENVLSELPATAALNLVGLEIDGGKLPFGSSFPDLGNIKSALNSETATDEEKLAKVGKELINPAAYWLLPFGGGQVKKVWQGISALKRQGSYTADGRLQYPIYTDREGDKASAVARTMLFGKSATPEAQAWVEAGFGALSAKATQTYEAMRAGGVDQRDSYELIKAMSKVKKTDTQTKEQLQMQLLNAFDIEDSGKVLYYYNMMANDEEREELDKLMETGADMNAYLRYVGERSGGWTELYNAARTDPTNYAGLRQAAIATAVEGGKTQKEAEGEIDSALRSQLKEDYKSGKADDQAVGAMLKMCFDADEHDVYWTLEEWKGGEDWKKYGKFLDAVEKGVTADTRKVAKYYMEHGVDKGTLSDQLTTYFKERWLAASGDEAARLKRAYISAYKAIGGDGDTARDNMIKWRQEANKKRRENK